MKKSLWLILVAPAIIVGVLTLSVSAQDDEPPHTIYLNVTGTPTLTIPHQYSENIYQANGSFSPEDFDGVQFVPITANYSDAGTSNPVGTLSASVLCVFVDAVRCQDRIFVKELASGDVIEIQGIPLPHRPFTNLQWLDDSLLTVDRWSQPHYGIRYIFDVPAQEVIVAAAIFDEFYAGTASPPSE